MRASIEDAISKVMNDFRKTLESVVDGKARTKLVDGVIDELVDKEEVDSKNENQPDFQIQRRGQ